MADECAPVLELATRRDGARYRGCSRLRSVRQLSSSVAVASVMSERPARRIRTERVGVVKWAATADRDADDIRQALDEALQLLHDPGTAYLPVTTITRRMFNEAVFDQLAILDDEIIKAVLKPWVSALEDIARRLPSSTATAPSRRPAPREAIRAEEGPGTAAAPLLGATVYTPIKWCG